MTYEELLDKWIRKLGRPCTAGEIVRDLRQLEQPVRCKECKWYYQHWIDAGIMVEHCHRIRGVIVKADGFCAWGERREDETD